MGVLIPGTPRVGIMKVGVAMAMAEAATAAMTGAAGAVAEAEEIVDGDMVVMDKRMDEFDDEHDVSDDEDFTGEFNRIMNYIFTMN
jgi:hypothetical protein